MFSEGFGSSFYDLGALEMGLKIDGFQSCARSKARLELTVFGLSSSIKCEKPIWGRQYGDRGGTTNVVEKRQGSHPMAHEPLIA